ncbi:MAG: hypothetical protein IJY25_03195 [Bacilli bacterium]|nr:hypothetical protein [Bacilli bacterium]
MLEQKIKSLYQSLYFKRVTIQKLVTMLKTIVIDKETDIDKISKKSNISVPTIKKYINSKELLLELLTEDEYNEFIPYRDCINNKKKQQEESEKYEMCKNVINDILETRFKFEEICRRNYITESKFKNLIKEEKYLIENFGKDIINQLKFRISETGIIRESTPRDKKIIEEAWDLKVVKDKIHCLDSYEFRVLQVVSNYLMSGANITFVSQKFEMPEQMVYNYITDPKVKKLIKEDYYNELSKCIYKEDVLRSHDLNAKRDLIRFAVMTLKKSDYNLEETSEICDIPSNLLERILTDDLLFIMYTRDEVEQIRALFVEQKKKETKRK